MRSSAEPAVRLSCSASTRAGAGPVLTSWVGYILTRPLGANIGDVLSSDRSLGGLVLFLGTILLVVVFLTITRRDVTHEQDSAPVGSPVRR